MNKEYFNQFKNLVIEIEKSGTVIETCTIYHNQLEEGLTVMDYILEYGLEVIRYESKMGKASISYYNSIEEKAEEGCKVIVNGIYLSLAGLEVDNWNLIK